MSVPDAFSFDAVFVTPTVVVVSAFDSVNFRPFDHGPCLPSASRRRIRHANTPGSRAFVGAQADILVVWLSTLFAGENARSPFSYTSSSYFAA